jgi:DNA-binding FrmR family transcriptional regulator
MDQREITMRLRKVEGQIRGLQRMVEEERDCDGRASRPG